MTADTRAEKERAPTRTTRPRNRRALIIDAATELFYTRGYDHVGLGDIAEAVGIVPSALYRHFSNRQDLMREVVLSGIAPARVILAGRDPADRDAVVAELVALALARPEIGVLWRREARHLDEENRLLLRTEIHMVGVHLAELVRAVRPQIGAEAAAFLGWSMFGVLLSASPPQPRIERPRDERLLRSMCLTVLDAEVSIGPVPQPIAPHRGLVVPASRREAILACAIRMFADEGFSRVGIENIGATVGIAGPSIYKHFNGKAEILDTAVARTCSYLRFMIAQSYAEGYTPREVLRLILHEYVDFSTSHPHLVTLFLTETGHLSEDARADLMAALSDLVAEFVRLLAEVCPTMTSKQARIRVFAVLSMVNDIARTPGLRRRVDVSSPLCALSETLLLLGD